MKLKKKQIDLAVKTYLDMGGAESTYPLCAFIGQVSPALKPLLKYYLRYEGIVPDESYSIFVHHFKDDSYFSSTGIEETWMFRAMVLRDFLERVDIKGIEINRGYL